MSDEDFFMNEEVAKNQVDDSESDLEDDWDVDEDEVAAKKAVKEAAKQAVIQKEAERVKKLEARLAAEKLAEEERIFKLNERKTQEQLEEELEKKAYEECNDFLGGDMITSTNKLEISSSTTPVDDDLDNPMAIAAQMSRKQSVQTVVIETPVVKREKDLYNFKPNCKPACDDYAKMLTKLMFEMQNDKVVAKNFSYLLESSMKMMCNEVPIENWETIKKLGSAISAIGNSKQQEFKKKNTKGKKKNTKPGLGGANKAADPFAGDDEVADFDDFM